MKKVFTVIGARPQFIKAAAVSRHFRASASVHEDLIHTGQHYDSNMSDVFFSELDIPAPKHHLGIAGGGHGAMTGRMLIALEDLFLAEKPDLVLVYGDTNSTLAGVLAAVKLHIPVAHVEAGLRSFNMRMPEEVNRVLADHASDLLFSPTCTATNNLVAEGVAKDRIIECGDVMFDAALYFADKAGNRPIGALNHALILRNYVLATIHRQENTEDPARLKAILTGLAKVAETIPVVLPLHPRTKSKIAATGLSPLLEKLQITEPLGYLDMVNLEKNAAVIATDSGGVQKEAFFYQVPCVTLRDETEWVELVEAGWNNLVPPVNSELVSNAVLKAIGTVGKSVQPYGDGNAAKLIVEQVEDFLK